MDLNSFTQTNTFQMVLITDEVRTYAMFIYDWMGWTTHTEVRCYECYNS